MGTCFYDVARPIWFHFLQLRPTAECRARSEPGPGAPGGGAGALLIRVRHHQDEWRLPSAHVLASEPQRPERQRANARLSPSPQAR